MPGSDGLMTAEENARALAWLNEKTTNFQCPVCNTNQWSIGTHIIAEQIHRGGNVLIGGAIYPMVFVTCSNCAYTRHFNAIQMGVIPKDEPQEVKSPKVATGG